MSLKAIEEKYEILKLEQKKNIYLCKNKYCIDKDCKFAHNIDDQCKSAESSLFEICIDLGVYKDLIKIIMNKFKNYYFDNFKNISVLLPSMKIENWIKNNTNFQKLNSENDMTNFGIVNIIVYFHNNIFKNDFNISPFSKLEISLCKETIRRNNVCKFWVNDKINEFLGYEESSSCLGGINCVHGIHPSIEPYNNRNNFGIVWKKKSHDLPLPLNSRINKFFNLKNDILKWKNGNKNIIEKNLKKELIELFIMNKYYYVRNIYKDLYLTNRRRISRNLSLDNIISSASNDISLLEKNLSYEDNEYNFYDIEQKEINDKIKLEDAFYLFFKKWDNLDLNEKKKYKWIVFINDENRISPTTEYQKREMLKNGNYSEDCFKLINF